MVVSFKVVQNTELVTTRSHKKILNVLFRETMTRHRDVGLQSRFRRGPKTRPGGEFGFEKRSKKYQKRKTRKKGHLKPDVWSGKTRDAAQASTVRATAKGGKIQFRASHALEVERRTELEKISSQELSKYIKTFKRRYTELANSSKFKRKRRKRVK